MERASPLEFIFTPVIQDKEEADASSRPSTLASPLWGNWRYEKSRNAQNFPIYQREEYELSNIKA